MRFRTSPPARTLWLVRHPEVARALAGRCYGASDPGLSRASLRTLPALALRLARLRPTLVVHSDRERTRALAAAIARAARAPLRADPRWRERDFGDWEGRTWARIHRDAPDALDRLARDPGFRPGGGETTRELAARVRRAHRALPRTGRVVVVTHGGPIAVLRAMLRGEPLARAPRLIPPPGAAVRLRPARTGPARRGQRGAM